MGETNPLCPHCNQRHGTTLGYRAYGRHRNVSLAAVQKAISLGRIEVLPGKKIDVAAADKAWTENSSPLPPPNGKQDPDKPQDPAAAKFADARARKEEALARKHEEELKKLLGQVVEIDYLERQATEIIDAIAGPVRSLKPRLIRELERAGVLKPGADKRAGVVVDQELDRLLEDLQRAGDHLPSDNGISGSSSDVAA